MNKFTVLLFLIISIWLGCSKFYSDPLDIYTPEILDDGKPNVVGDFWDIANSPEINLNQKAFIEAFTNGESLERTTELKLSPRIHGLGITDLSPLNGLGDYLGDQGTPFSKIGGMKFYSTRLKDISNISEFEELGTLVISGSDVEDFSPISNLKKLIVLDISYSRTTSLTALKDLTNLEELTLDSERNIPLDEIQHLILPHLNDDGETIKLKVIYHKEKRGIAPTHIFGNYLDAKVTPTLKGVFELGSGTANPKTEPGTNFYYNGGRVGNTVKGILIFTNNLYELNIEIKATDLTKTLIEKGSYTSIGNLITFQPDGGAEYTSSYNWSDSLGFSLIDRTNFPELTSFILHFKKKSDNPEN